MAGLSTDNLRPGDSIPDADHVTHYCRPRVYPDGQFTAAAFLPRASEVYLSVNWIEFFRAGEDPIERIRCMLGKKLGLRGCLSLGQAGLRGALMTLRSSLCRAGAAAGVYPAAGTLAAALRRGKR